MALISVLRFTISFSSLVLYFELLFKKFNVDGN